VSIMCILGPFVLFLHIFKEHAVLWC